MDNPHWKLGTRNEEPAWVSLDTTLGRDKLWMPRAGAEAFGGSRVGSWGIQEHGNASILQCHTAPQHLSAGFSLLSCLALLPLDSGNTQRLMIANNKREQKHRTAPSPPLRPHPPQGWLHTLRCQSLQTTTSPGPQSSISALVHCYTPHAADAAVRCEPRSAERGARPGDNDSCGQGHCLRPRDSSI